MINITGLTGINSKNLVLLEKAINLKHTLKAGVVAPTHPESIIGMLDAKRAGLIEPVIIGPKNIIIQSAENAGLDISGCELLDTPYDDSSLRAAELAASGKLETLIKGNVKTDVFMKAALKMLKTKNRISHVLTIDVPSYHKLMIVADVGINIYPEFNDKKDILKNTIIFSRTLGLSCPKVALLAPVETVNEKIIETVDAARLMDLSHEGYFGDVQMEGPLSFDLTVSREAADMKGIKSSIAGETDIFLVPNLSAGNMMKKLLDLLAGAQSAGIVLGTKVPLVMTSRAATSQERLISCALACLYTQR
ncbi:TPA: bifunctional enoyl-CoA hydratase/phosphate acetyltransferase [Raoultella planticola]|nr:bifunctional enoyl-CoA hydratase/phosphate acetyltransferase [Raoultella planticola]